MIVIDASAMVEALTARDVPDELLAALEGDIAAPHLLDVEVLSVLRRLVRSGSMTVAAAEDARALHFGLSIARYGTEPLADRIWALRHQFTSYDASYIALAEGLGVPLLTCDGTLSSPAHQASVRVLS